MEPEENYDPHSFEDDDSIQNSYVAIRSSDQDNYESLHSNLRIPNQNELNIEEQNVISINSQENEEVYIRNNIPRSFIESFLNNIAFLSTLLFLIVIVS
ncbi:hypothetical protein PGAL8A_00177400 [Plasmodium gallinaceum]|uniref:Uncharacterized protein n=1 Tax=Plasmodium gallinaceum TaxID=5849 RepID=A0A1J1GP41_PLAGA|nr:hypothetical protein PGAL8A_00177400 [Plasmodium gallinaceum]CRG94062.1 hypothetical protein PGAL8A_00177400 [Plasmodium gallinaceum]